MFKWFKRIDPESSGLAEMQRNFDRMLDEGRHIFDAAANAFLGGTAPDVVRDDLFATDKRINDLERRIRRALVVHGSVHGPSELPACLIMMSIVKDAERIGDYSKNLFDLAAVQQKREDDEYYPDLLAMKDEVSGFVAEARAIYGAQDEQRAKDFIRRGDKVQDHCDAKVRKLLEPEPGTIQPAATALSYRYYKRVLAHLLNIVTSIIMPIDRLDYYDEDRRTRSF